MIVGLKITKEMKETALELVELINEELGTDVFASEVSGGYVLRSKSGLKPRLELDGRVLSESELCYYLVGVWYGLHRG